MTSVISPPSRTRTNRDVVGEETQTASSASPAGARTPLAGQPRVRTLYDLGVGRLDPQLEERFLSGAREAARFFMNKSNVHQALERLVDRLREGEARRLPRSGERGGAR